MLGAAAGLAHEGFVPFATTYAVFAARRAYDFVHQAIAEESLPVKLVCALPGLTSGYGPSHQATEDIAIFRGVPGLTIVDPCDAQEIEEAVPAIAAHPGPVYMRILRGQVPLVLDEYDGRFELGKARMLRAGRDVLFVSSGLLTMRVLEAAKALRADRIDAAVLHVSTIKPLDEATIVEACRRSEADLSWLPKTIPSSAGWARRSPQLSCVPAYIQRLPTHRAARRVSRCRRATDAARALRHFDGGDCYAVKGLGGGLTDSDNVFA